MIEIASAENRNPLRSAPLNSRGLPSNFEPQMPKSVNTPTKEKNILPKNNARTDKSAECGSEPHKIAPNETSEKIVKINSNAVFIYCIINRKDNANKGNKNG
jgi:hypothetical protein